MVNRSFADILFWAAVVAVAVAQFFILRSTVRGMRTTTRPGSPFWEWTWAILPAFALVALFVWTFRTIHPEAS